MAIEIKIKNTLNNEPLQLSTIDSDYRSEIGVIVYSWECEPFICKKGTRIAQLVLSYVPETTLVQVNELDPTGRGGFGSTGTR